MPLQLAADRNILYGLAKSQEFGQYWMVANGLVLPSFLKKSGGLCAWPCLFSLVILHRYTSGTCIWTWFGSAACLEKSGFESQMQELQKRVEAWSVKPCEAL